jgi:hypothetical protein
MLVPGLASPPRVSQGLDLPVQDNVQLRPDRRALAQPNAPMPSKLD